MKKVTTNEFANAVLELRNAQRDYMTIRDSSDTEAKERTGRRVAAAAALVDDLLDLLGNDPRQQTYAAIDSERDYQDRETAKAERPDMVQLTAGDTLLAMEENLNRARSTWYGDYGPDFSATMHFVRKVCGLAVQLGERVGMPLRD